MSTIFLVRHGENDWVKEGRLAGWMPGVLLNDAGRKQAANVAQRLAEQPIQAVYSSPLMRCIETAGFIAARFDLPLLELEAVGEVRYGDWEGKKLRDLSQDPLWRTVQSAPSRMRFPNGESFCEVQTRAVGAIEMLIHRHEKESIVVVSHGDVIKLVLNYYLGSPIDAFQRMVIAPASVSVVDVPASGRATVIRINDDGPLRPPVSPPAQETTEANLHGNHIPQTA